jgi:hypothetical protein
MFWPDALATATYTLNRCPCRPRKNATPYELLFGHSPSYAHLLRVFGCLCYPNLTATAAHKLAPRSTACVFLGYPVDTKGYRCYNPSTRCVIVSRHVYFDEHYFPFRDMTPRASTPPSVAPVVDVVPTPPHRRQATSRRRHPAPSIQFLTSTTPSATAPSSGPAPAVQEGLPAASSPAPTAATPATPPPPTAVPASPTT